MERKWTWRRWLSGALALLLGANGLVMLFASLAWYGAVDGVKETGPFNPHFVRDIGAAYLVTAIGLAWFAWRPRGGWPALVAGALFLAFHAGIHVYDAACGREPLAMIARDFAGVFLPALIAVLIALRKPEARA
jgi:hypothetical protein